MSELLDALIQQRRQGALAYREYLERIADITRKAKSAGLDTSYPGTIKTPGRKALYDNLGRNEDLALAVDEAIRSSRQDGWRSRRSASSTLWCTS
jgi:type I restriction enzyme R subunit